MPAQPYASASYGALQLTLLAWTSNLTGQTLRSLFNLQDAGRPLRSVFELLHFTDAQGSSTNSNFEDYAIKKSLELGAAYSQAFQSDGGFARGACTTRCSQDTWAQGWSSVFVNYNDDRSVPSPFYSPGADGKDQLVKTADQCFSPTAFYLLKPTKGACKETTSRPLY